MSFAPRRLCSFLVFAGLSLLLASPGLARRKRTIKATEDADDVVKNKLYPKKGRFELGGPNLGLVLNQSYVTSIVMQFNANYYWREDWGFSLELLAAFNSDKSERGCIESFYNDFKNVVAAACPAPNDDPAAPLYTGETNIDGSPIVYSGASLGPAYVAVRELNSIVDGVFVWNPVYGKQIAFMAKTVYFDIFLKFGLGLTSSTFYEKSETLRNGNRSRSDPPAEDEIPDDCETPTLPGVCPDVNGEYLQYIGINGRPTPKTQIHPTLTLAVGEKFHFASHWNFKAEVRSYTLLGTDSGYDNFFMAWLGLGVRI